MTAEQVEATIQAEIDQLIADAEDELDRGLDDEEREAIIDDYLAGLDDQAAPEPVAAAAPPAPTAPSLDFDELAAAFFRAKAKAQQ